MSVEYGELGRDLMTFKVKKEEAVMFLLRLINRGCTTSDRLKDQREDILLLSSDNLLKNKDSIYMFQETTQQSSLHPLSK